MVIPPAIRPAAAACALALAVLATGACTSEPRPAPTPAPTATPAPARRAVAVLPFRNATGARDAAWIGRAVPEILSMELAEGERLRVVPVDAVVRVLADWRIEDPSGLEGDALRDVARALTADVVVGGEYRLDRGTLTVEVALRDPDTGRQASVSESGPGGSPLDVIASAGARARAGLLGEPPGATPKARAGFPTVPVAAKLYAEGLERLHLYDAAGAQPLLERAAAADPQSPLVHAALAGAWAALGYDARAREAAKRAFDLSGDLRRQDRLVIEARHHEAAGEWAAATEGWEALFKLFPDELDYGIRLATVQTRAGQAKAALATVGQLRARGGATAQDPRLDLAEAAAAEAASDFQLCATASARAADKGAARGQRSLVARARYDEGRAYWRLGQIDRAVRAAEEATRIAREVGDLSTAARTVSLLGRLRVQTGDVEGGERLHREALQISERIGDKLGVAIALSDLARAIETRGDLAEAVKLCQQAFAIDREISDKVGITVQLNNMGSLQRRLGNLAEARRLFTEALAVARELGDRRREGVRLEALAQVMHAQGDLGPARQGFEQALVLAREVKDRRGEAQAQFDLGELFGDLGQVAEARQRHEEARGIRAALKDSAGTAESLAALSLLALRGGDAKQGEVLARQAVAAHAGRRGREAAAAQAVLARALAAQDRAEEARAALAAARAAASGVQDFEPQAQLALAAAAAGAEDALAALRPAIAEAARRGYRVLQLEARLAHGRLERRRGQLQAGSERLREVARQAREHGLERVAAEAEREAAR